MKKIFFVIESLQYGGAERVLSEITQFLTYKGYEITVITFVSREREYKLDKKIRRINLEIPNSGIQKLIGGSQSLRKTLQNEKADICIAFDILANILLLLSAPTNSKVVISERNAPKQTELSIYSKILRFLLYRRANYYVFQTEEAAACYSKKIQNRSFIIPNPVLSNLPQKKYCNLNKEVIAIGRLEKQKNYELMLRSFREFLCNYGEYTLSIYGVGSEKNNLMDLCNKLGMTNQVVFKGNSDKVHELIKNAEIFLMTSDYEGIPNALMEAMAMGFPVIATDCPSGGVAMLIEDGINGILIEDKDEKKIAQAMSFYVNNPEIEERMGTSASNVRTRFSLGTIGNMWVNIIEQI